MKHAAQMRIEILSAIGGALERLRVRASLYFGDDLETLKKLEKPAQLELSASVTNHIMDALGHEKPAKWGGGKLAPTQNRFDKSRRSLGQQRRYAKQRKAFEQEQERAKSQEAARTPDETEPTAA